LTFVYALDQINFCLFIVTIRWCTYTVWRSDWRIATRNGKNEFVTGFEIFICWTTRTVNYWQWRQIVRNSSKLYLSKFSHYIEFTKALEFYPSNISGRTNVPLLIIMLCMFFMFGNIFLYIECIWWVRRRQS